MEQIETGSFGPGKPYSTHTEAVHLVTWNINRGLQLNGILDFLSDARADVILLQEADINALRTERRNVAREIARSLEMNYVFGCEFQELSEGSSGSPALHGQATLSRLPLSGARILRFRNQSRFWEPRWYIPTWNPFQRRLGGRMALVSNVYLPGRTLLLYNVHLESRGDDVLRCNQLSELFADVGQSNSDLLVVIAGDFNFDLSRQPAASIVRNMQFANQLNGTGHPTTIAPSGVHSGRAIDCILTKGPLVTREAKVHDTIHGSDHYPLSLVLR